MSLVSVEDAFDRLTAGLSPIAERERVGLEEAHGRILADDLLAKRTQPPFDASAMDGYALRAADCTEPFRPLAVIGEAAAGRGFAGQVAGGQCVRIFTGAPVPDGADAILIQENADRLADGTIIPRVPVSAGRHIRPAGVDFEEASILLPKGSRLNAARLGLAASGGHSQLDVQRRPRVAILATGDELVAPGEPMSAFQIVASNGYAIAAMARQAGADVRNYGIAPDREDAIGAFVDRAVADRVDILVTIGGASVGDHDLVGRVFASHGVSIDFWKLAMRPGKPLMAGRLGRLKLLGLPGNPASSLVTATLFLVPLIHALTGGRPSISYRDGILAQDMPENDERADFIRATIEDGTSITPLVSAFGRQDSSLLSVFARADVLLLRPPYAPAAKAGDACRFIPLP